MELTSIYKQGRAARRIAFIGNAGFSLVELMVAMALGSVVILAIYQSFEMQHATYLEQELVTEIQQNGRVAMEMLTNELRMAGYDPEETGSVAGFTAATSTSLTINVDADGDGCLGVAGSTCGDSNEEMVYSLYTSDGIKKLGRKSPSTSTNEPVAENIEAIEFLYLLADGTTTLTPTAAQLSDIRGVYVSILIIAAQPGEGVNNTTVYQPESVVKGVAGATAWGPYNDSYRRRILSRLVLCRNMGL